MAPDSFIPTILPTLPKTTSVDCPICEQNATFYASVDFNKSCADSEGAVLPPSGLPVHYYLCDTCQFVLAPDMCDWNDSDFLAHVYNDEYIRVDPDYVESRPLFCADLIHKIFSDEISRIRHLDYGGGNGRLTEILRERGFDTETFDPFPENDIAVSDLGKFNLITAFEVFEHVPDPNVLMNHLKSLMDEECLVYFTTVLSDGNVTDGEQFDWWYASPRNGHISLYSEFSLQVLAAKNGLGFASKDGNTHLFWNNLPSWAEKLFGTACHA